MTQINIERKHPQAIIPTYATDGSASVDLYACLPDTDAAISTCEHASVVIPTGIAVQIPDGHVLLIFSRSGHGFKEATRLGNCVGVIDSDYRGELMVNLRRDDGGSLFFTHGARVAQAMLVPIPKIEFVEVESLDVTERGAGGFGSTGS